MFLHSVVELTKVESLRSEEARARYLDIVYVARNPALFLQLDRLWLCRMCKKSVDLDSMPPMAARNMLGATWSMLPPYMRGLSQPELSMVGLTRVSGYYIIECFPKYCPKEQKFRLVFDNECVSWRSK